FPGSKNLPRVGDLHGRYRGGLAGAGPNRRQVLAGTGVVACSTVGHCSCGARGLSRREHLSLVPWGCGQLRAGRGGFCLGADSQEIWITGFDRSRKVCSIGVTATVVPVVTTGPIAAKRSEPSGASNTPGSGPNLLGRSDRESV